MERRAESNVEAELVRRIQGAIEREPRINLHSFPIEVRLDAAGSLVVEGDVENIAAKKLALELAAGAASEAGIIDRLRVRPARRMGDGELLDHVCRAIVDDSALRDVRVVGRDRGRTKEFHTPERDGRGSIDVEISDGIVTLNGVVPSLAHKRLAGVLAWWAPGTRDVINGIEVSPPEADSDDEVTEAVRVALEKDPLVNAAQVAVATRNSVVTLEGVVRTEGEKQLAEMDAWYVFAVDGVRNRLEVRS
jgi:osmotically-inducible protein OsmY